MVGERGGVCGYRMSLCRGRNSERHLRQGNGGSVVAGIAVAGGIADRAAVLRVDGIQVKLEALASKDVLIAGAALTTVAVIVKVLSGLGRPRRMNRLAVGFVMMPRGEVGLIFAGIGKSIGVADDGLFSAVILLVMVTTLLTPLALRWTLLGKAS